MSETKKRERPTWAQVRELEKKCNELQHTNQLLGEELIQVNRELEKERNASEGRLSEIERLKSRNFFKRLFSR